MVEKLPKGSSTLANLYQGIEPSDLKTARHALKDSCMEVLCFHSENLTMVI